MGGSLASLLKSAQERALECRGLRDSHWQCCLQSVDLTRFDLLERTMYEESPFYS